MSPDEETETYRDIIDDLVHAALHGSGQLARKRVLEGVWHHHVDSIRGDDEFAARLRTINEVLAGLDERQREIIASLLDEQYVSGVHDTLVRLHHADIVPFDKGYWDPHHDFINRLQNEDWPRNLERG